MKKFAMLLAAGVIALGASAQAASVESVTYAVITVPIVGNNGYNFIGAAVTPISGTYADDIFGDGEMPVLKYTGSTYVDTTAGAALRHLGEAVVYTNAVEATYFYEVGIATNSATATVGIGSGFTLVCSPFASAWTLSNTSLDSGSNNRYGAKANKVHIWRNGAWQTWWYKGNTADAGTWKCVDTTITDPPTIGAGEAVLIERGSANTATTVTFTAPQ